MIIRLFTARDERDSALDELDDLIGQDVEIDDEIQKIDDEIVKGNITQALIIKRRSLLEQQRSIQLEQSIIMEQLYGREVDDDDRQNQSQS